MTMDILDELVISTETKYFIKNLLRIVKRNLFKRYSSNVNKYDLNPYDLI